MPEPMIVGGNFEENKTEEVLETLRSNRTILVVPANDSANESPTPKQCENMEQVFDAFKPAADIPVKDVDGTSREHPVEFRKIQDFAVETIVDTVPVLKAQKEDLAVLADLRILIKENPRLRNAVDKAGEREKLIACLQEALKLLESTKH